jgi:23S rRNA (cytosine1962-C5)-methyltransferase
MIPPEKLPRLRLKKGRTERIRSGHPWVFSNELQEVPPLEPGCIAAVDGPGGDPLGVGIYNPHTLIAVRWLQRGLEPLAEDWLETRLRASAASRQALYGGEDCLRLAFSEADGLPGLVVDRYGDALVTQTLTAGMERLRPRIESALRDLLAPRLLVRRDDAAFREMEGLPRESSCEPAKAKARAEVSYLGLSLSVPLLEGQKTGLFLDQRENVRAFLRHVPQGASVLDVFCYLGVWGMSALKAGAASCDFVDASLPACSLVESALKANALPDGPIHHGDAFDVLAALRRAGRAFGAVVVDPPAFAKSRRHLPEALKGYQRLNELAMGLVRPGGILVSCSCSHHVGREDFLGVLRAAAGRSHREAVVLEVRGQAPDHPVLLSFPEGDYLKAVILRLS